MTKKKPDSKQKIVKAALDCFIKKGVVTTNFKEIAKAAGVHQPNISYHFKNFEELFAAVTGVLLEDLKQVSIEALESHSSDPYIALLEYAEIPLKWAEQKPEFTPIWTFFYHMASYHPYFKGINDLIRKGGRERITLLLYRIQESRGLKLNEGWTIGDVAYAIQSQITGDMVMAVTESMDLKFASKMCRKGVEATVRGSFSNFQ